MQPVSPFALSHSPSACALRVAGLLVSGALALCGCGSSGGNASTTSGAGGTGASADQLVFETAEYAVEPGQEKYMCYTMTTANALAIDRFVYEQQPAIHHLVLVHTISEESTAPFECDVLFKQTWLPVFANGTGSADVSTPPGSGFKLAAGSQILLQLHLLNTTGVTITGKASLTMHENTAADIIPAGIYAFGSQAIALPPLVKTAVTNDCKLDKDIHTFSAFPHMHKLGTSLTFWSGKDASSLTQQFAVASWSFGQQAIYPLTLSLSKGDLTRVTCTYDNTTSSEVTFGEKTSNEMCYFVTFVAPFDQLDGCLNLN